VVLEGIKLIKHKYTILNSTLRVIQLAYVCFVHQFNYCTFRAQVPDLSAIFREYKSTVISIVWLVDRRGFEPLASAVQALALCSSALRRQRLECVPVSTRTVWLPVGCVRPDIHFEFCDVWVSGGPWNTIVVNIWQIATHGGGAFT
jgi:hypothetical protein